MNAVHYLESLIPDPKKIRHGNLRLERIDHLLKLVGNPHEKFKSIHIGGTAGKGSTTYITAAILEKAGYKVGLHISPHLERVGERMQVNRKPISDKELAKLVGWIKPYVEEVGRKGRHGTPSYFEVIVALAFEYFKRKKVDIAVVEVGLGGALDATNVLNPLVAVITNVHLDHTHILGSTVEKIARDKAGIIKEGIDVVTAATQKSVQSIIKRKCKEKNAHLKVINPGTYNLKPKTSLIGAHQQVNIACAITAITKLHKHGFKITKTAIHTALKNIHIPGRFEIVTLRPASPELQRVEGSPLVILDGAHNPTKIKALVSALKEVFPNRKITFIFAVKKTKDVKKMLRVIFPIAKKIYFTRFSTSTDSGKNQSIPPKEITKLIDSKDQTTAVVVENPKKALYRALKESTKDDIICITGSLYLVAEIRSMLTA